MRPRTILAMSILTLTGAGVSLPFIAQGCRDKNEPAPLVKEVELPQVGGKPGANFPKLFSFDQKTLQLSLADDDTVKKILQQEGLKGQIVEKTLANFKDRLDQYNTVVAVSNRKLIVGPVDLRKTGQGFIPPFPPNEYYEKDLPTWFGCPLVIDPHNNMNPPVKGLITFNFHNTALVDSLEGKDKVDRVKLEFIDETGKAYDFIVPIKNPIVVIQRDRNGNPITTYHIDVNKAVKQNNNNEA